MIPHCSSLRVQAIRGPKPKSRHHIRETIFGQPVNCGVAFSRHVLQLPRHVRFVYLFIFWFPTYDAALTTIAVSRGATVGALLAKGNHKNKDMSVAYINLFPMEAMAEIAVLAYTSMAK